LLGRERNLTAKHDFAQSEKGSCGFKRHEHLKGRKEIREVFDKGKQFTCRGAKLFLLENDLPYNRICFTFSRSSFRNMASKEGRISWNAVSRNRAKRLGREAFRLMKERLACGYDLILLVYAETNMALSGRIKQLEFLFSKAGLFK